MRAAESRSCLALFALLEAACVAPAPQPRSAPETGGTSTAAPAPADPASSARARVVILGDSLTAGLGLEPSDAFPAVLQRKFDAERRAVEIVASGVSGDTTAGGLRRVDWALDGPVSVLVVALGGNDGLRGIPVAEMTRNLDAIIARAQQKGVAVLLCGMEAPPNLGEAYARDFRAAFGEIARRRGIRLLPFLLKGVGGVGALNQPDGIHPNAAGASKVADLVHAALTPLLPSAPETRAPGR